MGTLTSAWTEEGLSALLADCRAAAAAGAAVLSGFSRDVLAARVKGEAGNIVTDADLAAERVVRDLLHARRPGDAISGEELEAEATGSRVRWVIDPLDGTTNFTRQIPFWCTSVAAFDTVDRAWLAGAVYAPALARQYWAARGAGAWREVDGLVKRLYGPRADGHARLVGTGLSYSAAVRTEQLAALPAVVAGFTDVRRLGSAALDLCLVADGTLDAFVESDLGEHDWAAGALIAREAGVLVRLPQDPGGVVAAGVTV